MADLDRGPRSQVALLTCMDPRIEPLRIFGLAPGDAVVLRNAGGRVTDDVLRSLSLAAHLLGVTGVAIVQHTECALAGVEDSELAARVTARSGSAPHELLAMKDPDAALAADVERLRNSALLPPGIAIEGWRYDVGTGLVSRVQG